MQTPEDALEAAIRIETQRFSVFLDDKLGDGLSFEKAAKIAAKEMSKHIRKVAQIYANSKESHQSLKKQRKITLNTVPIDKTLSSGTNQ